MSRDPQLPLWLRTVPLPPNPDTTDAADTGAMPAWMQMPSDSGGTPIGGSSLPPWLADAESTPEEPPTAATPAWLSGSGGAPAGLGEPSVPTISPDWLQEFRELDNPRPLPKLDDISLGLAPPSLQGTPAPAELPLTPFSLDDLTVTPGTRTPTPLSDEDTPDWLRGDAPTPRATPPPAEDVPDWLRGDAPAIPPAVSSAPESSQVPNWLSDLAGSSSTPQPLNTPQPGVRSEELPSWLRGDAAPLAPPSPPAAAPFVPPAQDVPDWLRGDAPAASQPPAPAAAPFVPPAQDVPDWLRGDAPAAPPAAPRESMPDWLRGDAPAAPQPPAPAAAPFVPPAQDVPDWLTSLGSPSLGATPVRAEPPVTPVEDVPTWLRDASGTPPAPPAREVQTSSSDMPAWLREDQTPASGAAALPDWLSADLPPVSLPPAPTPQAAPTPPAAPAASAPAAAAPADIPDWLRGATPATPTPPAAPAAPPSQAASAPNVDLPDWMRSDTPASGSASDLPPWLQGAPGQPAAPTDTNLPSWLLGADTTGASPSAAGGMNWFGDSSTTSQPGDSGLLTGADLPAWMRQSRDRDVTQEPAAPSDARMLEFINKLIPADESGTQAVVTPTSPKLQLPAAPTRTQAQMDAMALLRQLAAEPPLLSEPAPVPANMNVFQRFGIERAIYLVLLAVMLVVLLIPSFAAGFETPVEVPAANAFAQQLSTLTEQDVVLVGYEWDVRRVSELRPLERAVLGQLIRQRVKLVLVSTDPQGTLLQFDLRSQLREPEYLAGGVDYLLLGYKSGGDAALRGLAQDLPGALRSDFGGNDATLSMLAGGNITGRPLQSIASFSAILVMADEPSDVQSWIEQIHTSAPNVPIGFLMPADVAPMMQPYLEQPGVFGLAGKFGALAYESQTGMPEQAADVLRETGQFRLSLLLFTALLLVGGSATLLNTLVQRRRNAS